MTYTHLMGKPEAGNPHIRFDEGEVAFKKLRRKTLPCKFKSVLFTCVVLAAVSAFAELGDGMVFWLRGGKDNPSSGKVGCLNQYEFPDALRASSGGKSWTDELYSYGASDTPATYDYVPYSDEEVIEPATGRSLGVRTCLDINQLGLTTNKCQFAILSKTRLHAFPTNSIGWSVFIRCRPRRSPVTPTTDFVFVNFLDYYGAGGSGLLLKFKDTKNANSCELGDNVKPVIQMGGSPHALTSMTPFKTNLWTDILVSVKTNAVHAYVIPEGGSLFEDEWAISDVQDFTKNGSSVYLGTYSTGLDGNKQRHGCGQIADFAYWHRGLSRDEALEMLQCPQTDYARLGVENGSSGEFAAQGSGCVTNGTWGEWRDLPGTLSAGRTATFSFVLPANYQNVNQILSLTAVPGSPVGPLPVKVNGSSVGDLTFGTASRKACLLISREKLVAGTNTVEIAANASAAVGIDTISVGGGWQVGVANGKGEGENTKLYTYTFNVGLSSTTNLSTSLRANTYWGTSSTSPDEWSYLTTRNAESFRFRVPESFLGGANNACRFVFRPLKASCETWAPPMSSTQEYTYRLYANGVKIGEAKALASSATTVKFNVPMSVFADSRECVLKVVNETEPWYTPTDYYYDPNDPNRTKYQWGCYYWNKIDYFSFEPFDRKGLIMVIR